ncbi:hypothetical protein Vadar_001136 [Vaccinium darrowii]|uniref:Uncharacterized protein n=1 Tax=Vaccinium darrowii TaxID=229202 RepID=A0ACB7X6X2_9ERIC|nr:hypothetical protein Vadar_001136 [Vaccinium darrowii]
MVRDLLGVELQDVVGRQGNKVTLQWLRRHLMKYAISDRAEGAGIRYAANRGWIVERGDDGIDPISGLSYELIGEAMGADEYLEPRRSGRNVGVRELHEDDFVSEDDADDDEEVDEDFECEDDEGLVMDGYGEEEEMEE